MRTKKQIEKMGEVYHESYDLTLNYETKYNDYCFQTQYNYKIYTITGH